jgi:nicotinamidase-related amidase
MAAIPLPVRFFRFFPGDAPLGETAKTLALRPEETALLLIDVYHAAAKPETQALVPTAYDTAWWRIVDERLVPVIAAARRLALPVIYTTNSSPRIGLAGSVFGQRLRESLGFNPEVDFREANVDPREYAAGEPVQLVFPPQIAPAPGDYYVRKHTYSGFFETRLDGLLRSLGVRWLVVAGFVADVCVQATLADAVFRGYQPVLLRDCTLAAELPPEAATFAHTARTILWIESFLCPTATSDDFIKENPEKG